MRRSEAFPSKYLGKDNLKSPLTVTINNVTQETIESDNEQQLKAVIHFQEDGVKPFICNVGNWMTIEDAYGEESDDWTGKRIELFVDPTVQFGGKRIGGVRVRIPSNGQAAAQPARTAPQQAPPRLDRVGIFQAFTDRGIDKERMTNIMLEFLAQHDAKTLNDTTMVDRRNLYNSIVSGDYDDAPAEGALTVEPSDIPF